MLLHPKIKWLMSLKSDWKSQPPEQIEKFLEWIPDGVTANLCIRKHLYMRIIQRKSVTNMRFYIGNREVQTIGRYPEMSVQQAIEFNYTHQTSMERKSVNKAHTKRMAKIRKQRLHKVALEREARKRGEIKTPRPCKLPQVKVINYPLSERYTAMSEAYAPYPYIGGRYLVDNDIMQSLPDRIVTVSITGGLQIRLRGGYKRSKYAHYIFKIPKKAQDFMKARELMPLMNPIAVFPDTSVEQARAMYNAWLYEMTGSHDFYYPQCERPDLGRVWAVLETRGVERPEHIEGLGYNTREAWHPITGIPSI